MYIFRQQHVDSLCFKESTKAALGKLIFFSSSSWNLLYIAMSSQKKLQEASTERWKNGKQNCELHHWNLFKSFACKVSFQTSKAQKNRYPCVCLQIRELLYFIFHLTAFLIVLRICWNSMCLWQRSVAFDHKKAVDPAEQITSVNTETFFLWLCVTVFSLSIAARGEEVLIWFGKIQILVSVFWCK